MSDNENTNKDFEVVTGDGSELELSEVYEHLNVATPKPKEIKKNIISFVSGVVLTAITIGLGFKFLL